MFSTIKAAALSTMIALGGLAAAPASAEAASFVIGFGSHGVSGHVVAGHHGRHHVRPLPPRRIACTPRHAVTKATRMGLRNARVISSNRNVIRVRGYDRYGRDTIRFAKAPGCPVIR